MKSSFNTQETYNLAESLADNFVYYHLSVVAKKYDRDMEQKMEELAEKCDGWESGSGMGMDGKRDVSYVFLTKDSVKSFLKKIARYIYPSRTIVTEYTLNWEDRVIKI